MPPLLSRNNKNAVPQHPGKILHKAILDSDLHVLQFAKIIGVSKFYLNDLIDGKDNINRASAGKFGRYFRNGSGAWLKMQDLYDKHIKANPGALIEVAAPLVEPVKPSRARGSKSHF
jgi:addiction module HigA family antidote